ncbi:MAG: ATP-binding cassette domain-containing protein [Kouleothrix sp.]
MTEPSIPARPAAPVPSLAQAPAHDTPSEHPTKLEARQFNFYYGAFQALRDVSLSMRERSITAIIGPSGCGKSTFLRAINRMHDATPGARGEGAILLDGQNIYGSNVDPVLLRRRIGMVFQRPNAFAKSIFDNVAYGLRVAGWSSRQRIAERVEQALHQAALWDEVKDRLAGSALGLSGGQQQRLCIATQCAEPRGAADGRAVLGDPIATPDRADDGPAPRVHDRDWHESAQHAADAPRLRRDRVYADGSGHARRPADRVRPDQPDLPRPRDKPHPGTT